MATAPCAARVLAGNVRKVHIISIWQVIKRRCDWGMPAMLPNLATSQRELVLASAQNFSNQLVYILA
jgi:hypothetical protein